MCDVGYGKRLLDTASDIWVLDTAVLGDKILTDKFCSRGLSRLECFQFETSSLFYYGQG